MNVSYCTTHHSPERRIGHLKLPYRIRTEVSVKLKQGVAIERILDDIRDTISGGVGREHLISRQDIYKIQAQFNIEGVIRHENDQTSVSAWVEEMQTLPYNPILLFKKQGQPSQVGTLVDTDFLLCIQTQFQRDMMKSFGSNTICDTWN